MRRIGDSGRETCTCAAYEVCYCILQNSHFIIKRNRDRPSPPVLPQVTVDTCVPSLRRGVRGQQRWQVLRIELGPQPRFHEQQDPEPDGAARLGLCFQRRRHRDSDRMGAFVSRKPAAGGAESRRACFAMALRRTFLLWNTFLGSFEWPQMYLLYHTNDPPARTYCTRAFGRVAHVHHRYRGGEL